MNHWTICTIYLPLKVDDHSYQRTLSVPPSMHPTSPLGSSHHLGGTDSRFSHFQIFIRSKTISAISSSLPLRWAQACNIHPIRMKHENRARITLFCWLVLCQDINAEPLEPFSTIRWAKDLCAKSTGKGGSPKNGGELVIKPHNWGLSSCTREYIPLAVLTRLSSIFITCSDVGTRGDIIKEVEELKKCVWPL